MLEFPPVLFFTMKYKPTKPLDLTKRIKAHRKSLNMPGEIDLDGEIYSIHSPKRVLVFHDEEKMDTFLANELAKSLRKNPGKGIIFPSGSTYHGFYEQIVRHKYNFAPLLRGRVHSNLDELYPLSLEDPNWPIAYITYMRERLLGPLFLDESQWIIPNSNASDPEKEADRIHRLLSSSQWALALLGIGPDAKKGAPPSSHIGFIPKGTPPNKGVMHVQLDKGTLNANRKSSPNPQSYPREAITQGPDNIRSADRLILAAKGENKRNNIAATLLEVPTLNRPSSLINILSDDVTVALDGSAAQTLMRKLKIIK